MNEQKELIIRNATVEDISVIAELEKICFPEDPWSYESILADISQNDKALYIVAEANEKIVGYVGVWVILDECHIMNVAVIPEERRLHIGDSLISAIVDLSKELGAQCWTLEVRVDNVAAINLYKKHGFNEAGIRKDYYKYDHTDALIMWK